MAAHVANVGAQHGRVAGQVNRVCDTMFLASDLAHFAHDFVSAIERSAVGSCALRTR